MRSKQIKLKKVFVEENPADLLTERSLSKERMEKLIVLFDCQFNGGRAETAPLTRTGASDKRTIAQADASIHNRRDMEKPSVTGSCLAQEPYQYEQDRLAYSPRMPHNILNADQLKLQYPSLDAVDDLDLPDLVRLEDGVVYCWNGHRSRNTLRDESSR